MYRRALRAQPLFQTYFSPFLLPSCCLLLPQGAFDGGPFAAEPNFSLILKR